MWTIDHEQDIASDLSVFHRVDDPMTLDGPLYFQRALRLGAYAGVIQARALEQEQAERRGHAPVARTTSRRQERPAKVSDNVALAQLADGWVEHVKEAG